MNLKKIMISTVAVAAVGTVAQSCLALATSSVGIAIIKSVLLGGITKGVGIFKNAESFKQSDLINKAMPSQLRSINSILEKVAPSLVDKQKDYIAQAAGYTVNLAEPILKNAVNSLTAQDVERIAAGGQGTATLILKEKTQQQLVQAIMPKVDQKLNEFGIVAPINNALKGNNLLGSLFGNKNSTDGSALSELASQQIVNGLFNVIEDYEKQNSQQIYNALGTKK